MPINKGGRPAGTPSGLPSDVEIAEAADLWPIARVAEEMLGVPDEALIPYGRHMAKLDRAWLATLDA